jgi:hypothetical protein
VGKFRCLQIACVGRRPGLAVVGTLLTLLFLPALYVAWFRIKEPVQSS